MVDVVVLRVPVENGRSKDLCLTSSTALTISENTLFTSSHSSSKLPWKGWRTVLWCRYQIRVKYKTKNCCSLPYRLLQMICPFVFSHLNFVSCDSVLSYLEQFYTKRLLSKYAQTAIQSHASTVHVQVEWRHWHSQNQIWRRTKLNSLIIILEN